MATFEFITDEQASVLIIDFANDYVAKKLSDLCGIGFSTKSVHSTVVKSSKKLLPKSFPYPERYVHEFTIETHIDVSLWGFPLFSIISNTFKIIEKNGQVDAISDNTEEMHKLVFDFTDIVCLLRDCAPADTSPIVAKQCANFVELYAQTCIGQYNKGTLETPDLIQEYDIRITITPTASFRKEDFFYVFLNAEISAYKDTDVFFGSGLRSAQTVMVSCGIDEQRMECCDCNISYGMSNIHVIAKKIISYICNCA